MRQWTVALLAVFALNAFAQEGAELESRVSVPGERAVRTELIVTNAQMDAWDLAGDDREAVKKKVADLNQERVALIEKLRAAREKVAAARRELRGVLAQLAQQEQELYAYVKPMLPESKKGDFDIRVQLQPLISWLSLSDDQANQLVAARSALINEFGGRDDNPAARLAKAATETVTAENRAEYKELVKKYMEFNKKWFERVQGVLNEEQRKIWGNRFRRTNELISPGLGL